MAITKELIVDRIEVVENGSIQVRTKTAIMEEGKQISSTFHRHVVAPGDDYSGEDARVKAICSVTYTTAVVNAYQTAIAQQQNIAA